MKCYRVQRLAGTKLPVKASDTTIFGDTCRMGLEGIVTKRRDRPHRSGRSPDWIKIKNPNAPAAKRIMEW